MTQISIEQGGEIQGFVAGRHVIDAYGNGGFRFADMSHRGSLLVVPAGVQAWTPQNIDQISTVDLAPLIHAKDDFEWLLVGTGSKLRQLPASVRSCFLEHEIKFEIMPTSAAARTYNILIVESRKIAAALIAV